MRQASYSAKGEIEMKRIVTLTLVLTMILAFAACGGKADKTPGADMSVMDILKEIMSDVDMEIDTDNMLLDSENFKYFAFIDYKDGYEAACNEALVNACAHSVVLVRVPDGDDATEVIINWDAVHYGSNLIYDADSNAYFRYMRYPDDELIPYEDRDTQEQLSFANVIIQFCETEWSRSDAPITQVVGEGNADFFMAGKHVAGYWKREDMSSRTVFYGPDGNEMPMQRGKTLIVIIPPEKTVSYN